MIQLNKFYLQIILTMVITAFGYQSQAQSVGEWNSHLPYGFGTWVTQSDEDIIYTTGLSLFYIDKEDLNPTFVDKIKGLSDVGIARIKYDNFNDQLIVAYNNSNIDIIKGAEVINLPFIKENSNILGDRQINDIYVDNENFAYLSTAFGIVQLNLQNLEFGTTIFTDIKVNSFTSFNNDLYAATDDGLYQVDQSSVPNIGDFSKWSLLGEDEGLPMLYEAIYTVSYGGSLYFIDDKTLYKSEDGKNFTTIYTEPESDRSLRYLSAEGAKLIVGNRSDVNFSRTLFFDSDDTYIEGGSSCINRTRYAVEDQFARVWYADDWRNIRHTNNYIDDCQRVEYESPFDATISDIKAKKGRVLVGSGGVTDSYVYNNNSNGLYLRDDGEWRNFNSLNIPEFSEKGLANFFKVEQHISENKIYVGTYWNGIAIIDLDTEEYTYYNKDNSILQGAEGDGSRTRISGLAMDDQGNLWMANHKATKPIAVLTAEGSWHNFTIPGDNQIANITIDQQGYKWMTVTGLGGGLVVYDDNGTIADPTDDRSRYISTGNSELPSNVTRTIKVDLDGNVWVGTAQGVVVFECGGSVFDSEVCTGSRRKVVVDGIVAFLLDTEDVSAIEVDGANRKWFGSRNGIFVQSPDGEDQVLRITSDNSPLYDDNIVALGYDGSDGLMWIGSNSGLQSLKTETLGATTKHARDVYAYPNPVRPEYTGPIAIKGLAADANVKITDINGRLVYETTALGGQAIWDGNDYNGRRADTGVYLVFSSGGPAFGTPDSYVSKILMVKE